MQSVKLYERYTPLQGNLENSLHDKAELGINDLKIQACHGKLCGTLCL